MVKLVFKCLDCEATSDVYKKDEDLSDPAIPMCLKHSKPMKMINVEILKKNTKIRRPLNETIQ